MARHIALLGDSIFDNAAYVPGGPSVIEHVRRLLRAGERATMLAQDGAVVSSVFSQAERLPADVTHIVLSVGGNNALWTAGNLYGLESATVREALSELTEAVGEFAQEYRRAVNELRELRRPLTLCTVYDAIPGLEGAERAGLCVFNDFITRTAFATGATLIDLRLICDEPADYSSVSPIEPSAMGGGKIARAIMTAVADADMPPRIVAT